MQTPRDWLTPEALTMLQTIAQKGSFAAAARALHLVPSALTYRVRQLEDALDELLFDRGSRRAVLTPAGTELLRSGAQWLDQIDALAQRMYTMLFPRVVASDVQGAACASRSKAIGTPSESPGAGPSETVPSLN